ncbi:DUF1127 domain-containing protein [Roseivivax sediminis]|uniref:DUF1127 domain-containing protein n=1 Tax=Roseivivax sediminis TaxID=936889 RepID=A0A1I1WDD9_9RHOB|nr:DUF1127 domain-containing protein [Roseivivax sediminis]SFD92398.1 hypothetical protein SAMN04515678_104230 [Roseivivax sediminis]
MTATDFNSVPHHTSEGRGLFGRIADFFRTVAESTERVQSIRVRHSLSDAELAARGLKREDLAQYVYRDTLHV